MFSKYFASSLGSALHHLAAAAATLESPPFPRIILLKLSLLSTSTAAKDRSIGYPQQDENGCLMSDFLLNECGLCQSEVSRILERRPFFVRTRSTHTAQQAVRFLRDLGCTEQQVRMVITRHPSFLTTNAEKQLKPKHEFMKTLGFTTEYLRNVISFCPGFFDCSLEKTLCPNILYLQNLVGSEADISRVFKAAPWILHTRNGPENFEKRLKHLTSFGLPEDKIKELVRRFPRLLTNPIDKVQKTMDFFIHTAGLPAKFVLTYPLVLNYSLECRIKPRYKVFKSISAIQPSERLPPLYSVVCSSEPVFLKMYVNCSPHATKLLELYRGKPVDLDVI